MDVAALSRLMLRSARSPEVEMFSIHRDRKLNWINFVFAGASIGKVWTILRAEVLNHRQWGPRLQRSSIVTCEGSRGWNNYLLLHHFNTDEPLDMLTASGKATRNPRGAGR